MRHSAIGILILISISAYADSPLELIQSPVESWSTLDVEQLNRRIEETSVHSPLLLMLHLFGDDEDTRVLVLEEVKNRSEGADETRIDYLRDGLLDGSIRSDRHEVGFKLSPDGIWKVSTARVAYRCWRAEDPEIFSAGICP